MQRLSVLYDANCGFCRSCRTWLERQPKYLAMEFLAQNGERARRRWPTLATDSTPNELIVVSDEGGVYRRESAYIMVLYALRAYRSMALKLAHPALRPLARRAFRLIADNRYRISVVASDRSFIDRLRATPDPTCDSDRCAPRPPRRPTQKRTTKKES